jgi:hypothetical protein
MSAPQPYPSLLKLFFLPSWQGCLWMNEWVLITTCKQLVWSTRIGRNMSIWNPLSNCRVSIVLLPLRGNRDGHNLPRRNVTTKRLRMGQDYPPTGPSPGANPTIYPSSLPRASGNLFSDISPKSHGFFFGLSEEMTRDNTWWTKGKSIPQH